MIGISVSRCVEDIAKGMVPLGFVEKIIGSITVKSDEDVNRLILKYRQKKWHQNPNVAELIFRQLLAAGKIEQPRLVKESRFPMVLRGKHWVKTEDEIVWHDQMLEDFLRGWAQTR